ncbi:MAG: hypothetical protein PHR60_05900 [Eubacteriales bacterium]|nr:hypothetical protein [Eubacteriales bacterium]
MDKRSGLILSLDTSNYTTSLAVVDKGYNVIVDRRNILEVKPGERGLRQSNALFQHIRNLPSMIEETLSIIKAEKIIGIAVSNRPRPMLDSYMPVFNAGISFGRVLAAGLGIPLLQFSHQEGHLAAAAYGSTFDINDSFLAFHLSGGTCELLSANMARGKIEKIGRSKDISFGQLIDRVGVAMGMDFPAGKEMDKLALKHQVLNHQDRMKFLTQIPFNGLDVNLSGLETQAMRLLDTGKDNNEQLCYNLFCLVSACTIKWTEKAVSETGGNKVLFAGGVVASEFLRKSIRNYFIDHNICIEFAQPWLSTDNAVGIGLLGGKTLWQ